MHRVIFILLLCCTNAVASDQQSLSRQQFCSNWEDMAHTSMTSRQAGVPLKTMLMLVSDETAVAIFSAAYEQPRLASVPDQQGAISDFAMLVLSECLKS